ncbi:MAG TPA: C13 family peptidase [Methylibium sp.]
MPSLFSRMRHAALTLLLASFCCCGLLAGAQAMAASSPLQAEYAQAQRAANQAGEQRLVLVAAAMDASSQAFVGDVKLVERELRRFAPGLVALHLANVPGGPQRKAWPEATPRALQLTLARAGTLLHGGKPEESLAVVLLSSHGHVGLLSAARNARDYSDVHVSELREWLQPLGETPTLLIISSCYSGSLIPLLEQDNRIIITAASDRTSSFGCEPESHNTYFIDSLFGDGLDPKESLEQWFARGAKLVAQREAQMQLTPPSNPQLWVGKAMKRLANRPLRELLGSFGAGSPSYNSRP